MDNDLTFIETQFLVSKLSKESYKERMGNSSQTLTGLGKWWGRKPLILVRAAILGLLMPSSNDPKADRAAFLKLLTMDDVGLWRRKSKNIALKDAYILLTPAERNDWFQPGTDPGRRGLGINGTENAFKPYSGYASSRFGSRKGRNWPCAIASGSVNKYRPSKLMCSKLSGESLATSSSSTG
jgi:hypothetical protein